jgi:hypothetical protein
MTPTCTDEVFGTRKGQPNSPTYDPFGEDLWSQA